MPRREVVDCVVCGEPFSRGVGRPGVFSLACGARACREAARLGRLRPERGERDARAVSRRWWERHS